MSTISYTASIQTSKQTTTSTSNVAIPGLSIPSSFFTAGNRYFVFANLWVAATGSAAASTIVHTVHGGIEFTGSLQRRKLAAVNAYNPYTFFGVFSASAGESVALEFRTDAAATCVAIDQACLFVMSLEQLQNSDYIWTQTGNDLSTQSFAAANVGIPGATASFTPNGTDDWLIMTAGHVINSASIDYGSLLSESVAPTSLPRLRQRQGNGNDVLVYTNTRVFTPSAVNHIFQEQSLAYSAPPGSGDGVTNSSIFALRLNAFRNHTSSYIEPGIVLQSASVAFYQGLDTASYTNDIAGDSIMWSFGHYMPRNFANICFSSFDVDGNDQPPTIQADNYTQSRQQGSSDEAAEHYMALVNLSAGNHNISTSGSVSILTVTANSPQFQQRSFVAFSMEIPGGGVVTIPLSLAPTPGAGPFISLSPIPGAGGPISLNTF